MFDRPSGQASALSQTLYLQWGHYANREGFGLGKAKIRKWTAGERGHRFYFTV